MPCPASCLAFCPLFCHHKVACWHNKAKPLAIHFALAVLALLKVQIWFAHPVASEEERAVFYYRLLVEWTLRPALERARMFRARLLLERRAIRALLDLRDVVAHTLLIFDLIDGCHCHKVPSLHLVHVLPCPAFRLLSLRYNAAVVAADEVLFIPFLVVAFPALLHLPVQLLAVVDTRKAPTWKHTQSQLPYMCSTQ